MLNALTMSRMTASRTMQRLGCAACHRLTALPIFILLSLPSLCSTLPAHRLEALRFLVQDHSHVSCVSQRIFFHISDVDSKMKVEKLVQEMAVIRVPLLLHTIIVWL